MKDNNLIPGIYNHCDRWCERCNFTNRCEIYSAEERQSLSLKDKESFMTIVSQNLSQVKEMLQKMAEEKGIDLDEKQTVEAFKKHQHKTKQARAHALSQKALNYSKRVKEWLETHQCLDVQRQKLEQHIQLGVNLDKNVKTLQLLNEAIEIIQWYLYQIHVKLSSAIRYYPHDPMFEDELNNMHHSSAKIALIGVENSMKAWQSLLSLLKEEEDFILKILINLQQLEKDIHHQFPLLYKYKRPVFDD